MTTRSSVLSAKRYGLSAKSSPFPNRSFNVMPDFLNIDLVQLVQLIGYPGIAAVIFLESGVFFGFFLPGGSLLFTAGVLASADVFNIWILLPLLVSAAILGDNVGYWFGAKVGIAIFKREDSRFFKKKHVQHAP